MSAGAEPQIALYRKVVLLFCGLCLALPVVSAGVASQDAATFLAAAELAMEGQWEAVYPSWAGERPVTHVLYDELYCQLVANATLPCEDFLVPFISPPLMLVLTAPVAWLPFPLSILVFRAFGAACIAWGAYRLWERSVHARPFLARPLAVGLWLLLPLAVNVIENGQNSPWLFAATVAGWLGVSSWPRSIRVGGLLAACTTAKISPLLMGAFLLQQRAWHALAVAGGLLGVLAIVAWIWVPPEVWAHHTAFIQGFSGFIVGFHLNTSIDAAWHQIGARLLGEAPLPGLFTPLKAAGIGLLGLYVVQRTPDPGERWLLGWMVWLLAIPLNWVHYNWVAVAALMGLVGSRLRTEAQGWALAGWLVVADLILWSLQPDSVAGVALGALWLLGSYALCVGALLRERPMPRPAAAPAG